MTRWIDIPLVAGVLAALCASGGAFEAIKYPVDRCGFNAYHAQVVRVIDGANIVANMHLGFGIWRMEEHLRLSGIDTPDVRGFERYANRLSKAQLIRLLGNGDVVICTHKDERSRVRGSLAEVFVRGLAGQSANAWLLANGFASPSTPQTHTPTAR